ncbi:tripartite tricarboxylate transporter substrate binding protein [Bacillus sp. Xin]|uniref:tripartite tricarboxylate transporter substrate binding protein n=1 Tax=unclassified Bacillus (in: firmicutes) TaxID=185979 RepID=UPI001573622A|nr:MULTISPECIES: tripartite tricarboxylate transporter substrate binding protein [unclassified Bacillus (in: firmicutes)]MBC6972773.1 tripartite tricarboxylate transporter substrate binding protein [Bacillus sp. Xin]NSW38889.1 tripartite tricarboxylate transporter substrate binding protein [Bacillus sp. Xin1]
MKKRLFAFIWLLAWVIAGCSLEKPQATNKIDIDQVEFVAPNVAGAGWDLTARAIQKTLQEEKIFTKPIVVTNKIGGSGDVGWKYTKKKGGHVLAINSSLLITNHLLGHSKLTYKDFTPIATLAAEWEVVVVSKDTNINNGKELMEKLKKDKNRIKIGVAPGLGNDDHLSFVQVSKASGINPAELEFFVYENKENVINALIDKQIDVATLTLSEAEKQYKAGKVKILAVSSPERLKELPEVPTWKEQGTDVVFQHWKGVMGPPDMTEEEVAYWDGVIGAMVTTETWKSILEEKGWGDFYKDSGETRLFLERKSEVYEGLMYDSGDFKR